MTPSNGDMAVAIGLVQRYIKLSTGRERAYSEMDGNQRTLVIDVAKSLKVERVWARRAGRFEKRRIKSR